MLKTSSKSPSRKRFSSIFIGGLGSAAAAALLLIAPGSAAAQSDGSSSTTSTTSQAAPPVDPCSLIPLSEASALAGANFSTPTHDSSGSTCIYGSQTLNVFTVTAAQASDPATAQAQWSQYEAKAQDLSLSDVPAGVTVAYNLTDLPDLAGADRATLASGSASLLGRSISVGACYLLKGATFVAFTDLQAGSAAPTADALQAEAATVLSRIP